MLRGVQSGKELVERVWSGKVLDERGVVRKGVLVERGVMHNGSVTAVTTALIW